MEGDVTTEVDADLVEGDVDADLVEGDVDVVRGPSLPSLGIGSRGRCRQLDSDAGRCQSTTSVIVDRSLQAHVENSLGWCFSQ